MKIACLVLSLLIGFSSLRALAAQNAIARLYSLSARFSQGTSWMDSTLDLTTLSSGINGELAPGGAGYSHNTTILLYDSFYDVAIPGDMYLDIPFGQDSNGDGFNDFYDVSCASSGGSVGEYNLQFWGPGTVSASWNRAAGSKTGTCNITLEDFGTFSHTFEIQEYRGKIAYVPGTTQVDCQLSVTNTDQSLTLKGQMFFQKDSVYPFDVLHLQSGVLTNAALQLLQFTFQEFNRDATWPTNYYGLVEFQDGDLATGEEDYYWWQLSIDDLNDADADTIPDFSDTPSAVRRAVLSVSKNPSGFSMQISADIGTSWKIESSGIPNGGWVPGVTVNITSDPQPVPIPAPSTTTFWRALKQ